MRVFFVIFVQFYFSRSRARVYTGIQGRQFISLASGYAVPVKVDEFTRENNTNVKTASAEFPASKPEAAFSGWLRLRDFF